MLGNRTSEEWIAEYASSHTHPVNRACHTVGIPMIALAVLLAIAGFAAHALWAWAIALFVVGWVFQFVGHWYEGRKPAFVDDFVGLLVGPMFVTAEAMFMLGWNKPLQDEIEQRVGPTTMRDMARIA